MSRYRQHCRRQGPKREAAGIGIRLPVGTMMGFVDLASILHGGRVMRHRDGEAVRILGRMTASRRDVGETQNVIFSPPAAPVLKIQHHIKDGNADMPYQADEAQRISVT